MKKNKKIIFTLALASMIVLNLFTLAAFGKIGPKDEGSNPINSTTCYQTFGYCSAWTMGYKCTLDPTAEKCHTFASNCRLCNTDGEESND